jgi:hypothetical protein
MTAAEVMAALPGMASYSDGTKSSPAPFGTANLYWESDETGVSVCLVDGFAVSISASAEFIVGSDNLIGMPAAKAIWRVGGEVSRDGSPFAFVETAGGVQLCIDVEDDVVLYADLEDYSGISD